MSISILNGKTATDIPMKSVASSRKRPRPVKRDKWKNHSEETDTYDPEEKKLNLVLW